MSKHFIHYIPRYVVIRFPKERDDPWYAEVQEGGAGLAKPRFHTPHRVEGAAAAVKVGDTIWIVGQLFSPWGQLPPALDARIDVGHVEEIADRPGRRYTASNSSKWFPLADMTQVLQELETETDKGVIRKLRDDPSKSIGHYLQSMRKLVSAEPTELWESKLSSESVDFVSYRLCDGTRPAFKKVEALVKQRKIVFWDRWSLPRRLAERRELFPDAELDLHLLKKLEQSAVVWGIESKKYSLVGSYSAKERDRATELGKYLRVPIT